MSENKFHDLAAVYAVMIKQFPLVLNSPYPDLIEWYKRQMEMIRRELTK